MLSQVPATIFKSLGWPLAGSKIKCMSENSQSELKLMLTACSLWISVPLGGLSSTFGEQGFEVAQAQNGLLVTFVTASSLLSARVIANFTPFFSPSIANPLASGQGGDVRES